MTVTQPAQLSEEDAKQYVSEDLKRMIWHGARMRSHVPPRFHYLIADFLQGARHEWVSRTKVLLGFRFAAKTWIFRQYCKFRWRRCPLTQFIIHSSNDRMAKKFVKAIREELELDPLMQDLRPESSSSDFEFNLRGVRPEQGYSIVAAGIKTSLTGSRSDVYAFDDPEPEVDPESMRERILQAIGEAGDILHVPDRHIHLMLDENGLPPTELPVPERTQLVVIGQPHCATTAYLPSQMDDDEEDGHPLIDAKFLSIPVIDKAGDWRWPEMMNRKYFNYGEGRPMTPPEVKRTMVTSRWELQYMINTGFAEIAGPVLRLDEIEVALKVIPNPIVIIDPADSETGSEWGIAVLGLVDRMIHIGYLGGFRAQAYEGDDWESMGQSAWRRIFDIGDEFHARRYYLEVNLKSAATACRRFIVKNDDVKGTVFEYRATRQKKRRIPENLEQPINNRMVSASPDVIADRESIRQLRRLRWDRLPNPCDRIDALASGFEILMEEPHLTAGGDARDVLKFTGRPESYSRFETTNSYERL